MKKEGILNVWKKVFLNKNYLFLLLILAVFFYIIGVFFANLRLLLEIVEGEGFFKMLSLIPIFLVSYKDFFTIPFFIGLIILSILFGMLFSLIIYKTKMLKHAYGKDGVLTSAGIFFGIIAPGCSACGIGLLSFFGISSSALVFLPFGGFTLTIISIIIMSFLVYKISKDLEKGLVCEIPKKKNNN